MCRSIQTLLNLWSCRSQYIAKVHVRYLSSWQRSFSGLKNGFAGKANTNTKTNRPVIFRNRFNMSKSWSKMSGNLVFELARYHLVCGWFYPYLASFEWNLVPFALSLKLWLLQIITIFIKASLRPASVNLAEMSLEDILTDHAYCEQKAASHCISLIQKYPEYTNSVDELAPIVTEDGGISGWYFQKSLSATSNSAPRQKMIM